jgi:hypothetical protein
MTISGNGDDNGAGEIAWNRQLLVVSIDQPDP